ncbi:unnamed protein product [Anisakis simplex]|uniref:U1-type domain-containing protein n=1 Tax=Anisakis simplex TaxID=6269 RepID=A0A0M3KEJ6_ANISI|nr:unnamed protein product [Anisakis simplex]
MIPPLIQLDTSKNFFESVVPFSIKKVEQFLDATTVVNDNDDWHSEDENNSSDENLASDLGSEKDISLLLEGYEKKANMVYHCDICNIDVHGSECWERHLKGKRHRKANGALKRRLAREEQLKSRDEDEKCNDVSFEPNKIDNEIEINS